MAMVGADYLAMHRAAKVSWCNLMVGGILGVAVLHTFIE